MSLAKLRALASHLPATFCFVALGIATQIENRSIPPATVPRTVTSLAHYVSNEKAPEGLFRKHMCASERNRTPILWLEARCFTTKLRSLFLRGSF